MHGDFVGIANGFGRRELKAAELAGINQRLRRLVVVGDQAESLRSNVATPEKFMLTDFAIESMGFKC